jgi:uncharacterized damage-inducible protein DinB
MRYQFLIDTYETERLKVLSVWSMFHNEDLPIRPRPIVQTNADARGRSVLEQIVHQLIIEDGWFKTMLGIDVGAPPLPASEDRLSFIRRYAEDSEKRLNALRGKQDEWWEQPVNFFGVERSRAWVMVRRIAHTSHHRGQQMAMLRMLARDLHSNYGPTADTGGLAADGGRVIYAYRDVAELLEDGPKSALPGPPEKPVTERGTGQH